MERLNIVVMAYWALERLEYLIETDNTEPLTNEEYNRWCSIIENVYKLIKDDPRMPRDLKVAIEKYID